TANITVVNYAEFPTPYALEISGKGADFRIYIASPATGELAIFREDPKEKIERLPIGDRPRTLALYRDPKDKEWLVVGLEGGELVLMKTPASWKSDRRSIALPHDVQDVAVDSEHHLAYATSHEADAVYAVDLETREIKAPLSAGQN